MAGIIDFERRLESICSDLFFVKMTVIFAATESSKRWRVVLMDDSFVDVYFSDVTGKVSFAHIKDGERIFGADNAGGWHWHPREDPESHVPSASEITIEEFMKRMEASYK